MLPTKCLEIIDLIYTYKKYSALNNLQWLICHKTVKLRLKIDLVSYSARAEGLVNMDMP